MLASLSLYACGSPIATPTPTSPAMKETATPEVTTSIAASALPSSEPPPTAPPAPTYTPVKGPIGDLILGFHQMALKYEVATWEAGTAENGGALLAHRTIANCSIREEGATEAPPIQRTITLGNIVYDLYEAEDRTQGVLTRWHLAQEGFDNPIRGNEPILIVTAPLEDPDPCVAASYQVLGTLYNPASP